MALDDDVDISGMPAPPSTDDADISAMPDPATLFKQRVGRGPETPYELDQFKQHPENFAGAPAAPAGRQTFGSTLLGEAELGGSMIGNIPHAAAHAVVDLSRRLTGGNTEAPDPALVRALQVPVGAAGQKLVSDVKSVLPHAFENRLDVSDEELRTIDPSGKIPIEKLRAMYKAESDKPLAQSAAETGTVAGDILSGGLHVGGDVANLLPAVGAARAVGGLAGKLGSGAIEAGSIKNFGQPGEIPPTEPTPVAPMPGPITGDELRSGPDPLASKPAPAAPPTSETPTQVPPEGGAAPGAPNAPTEPPAKPRVRLNPDTGQYEPAPAAAPSEPQAAPATVNVSLHTNNGKPALSRQAVVKALKDTGVDVHDHTVHASDTEPTLVARISRPLTEEEGDALSKRLHRDAIAQQHSDGSGVLYGPKAREWRPYNPEYFLNLDGTRASENVVAPSKLAPVAQAVAVRNAPEPVRFTAPTAEGAVSGARPAEEQTARLSTIHDLNRLSGGQLGEVRTSAITGDTQEAGVDYTHAKPNDAGGKRMQGVIANETNALRDAAKNVHDNIGSVVSADDPEKLFDQRALNERGTVITNAISKIQKWFDDNIKSMYQEASARAKGAPIQNMARTQALVNDPSEFLGTTEGEALLRGVQARMRTLGLTNESNVFNPPTVEQAERFRQFLGERWTRQTAGLINKLRDAIDMDVAENAGTDLFQRARALRAQKGKMLEDPTGIAKLLAPEDRLQINRDVPIEQVPDYVANLPREQFNHVVNVLRSAAHLGEGELAEDAAGALREIKGHMAARLQEAGGAKIQGGWSAKDFYKQLDKYSQKMPAVFRPEEIQAYKTINDASNVLRMDRTYKGAKIEEYNAGISGQIRERAATAARAGVDIGAHALAGPLGPVVAEISGISSRVGKMVGGNPEAAAEAARLRIVEDRITKLGELTATQMAGTTSQGANAIGASKASTAAAKTLGLSLTTAAKKQKVNQSRGIVPPKLNGQGIKTNEAPF